MYEINARTHVSRLPLNFSNMESTFDASNNFFDKIFVITLERSTNRQDHINKALDGLNYQFFLGADKNNLSLQELNDKNIYDEKLAMKRHRYSKPMNEAQVGCALSHKNIYEDIVKNEYKRVLILEDDAEPITESFKQFSNIINELPDDWELLYLDYSKNEKPVQLKKSWYHLQKLAGALKWDHRIISNLYPTHFSKYLSVAGFHDYTDAYAVTLSGAKKLIELQTPVSYVADNLLAIAAASKKLNAFISHPKLFQQLSRQEYSGFDSLL